MTRARNEGFTAAQQLKQIRPLGPGGSHMEKPEPNPTPSTIPTTQTPPPASSPGQVITAQSGGLPGMTAENSTEIQCPDGTTSQNGLCP